MAYDRLLPPLTQARRWIRAAWHLAVGPVALLLVGATASAAAPDAWSVLAVPLAAGWKPVGSNYESQAELSGERALVPLPVFPRDGQPAGALRHLNDQVDGQISALADDEQVVFQNLNDTSMNPDGSLSSDILPDLLHLSEPRYRLRAEQLTPTLRRLIPSS
jgi:hypothetical protein